MDGQHHAEHAQQGDEAAGQRVDEELARRVPPLRAAPDADEEEERHQRQLEEHVEEHDVERQEDAEHRRLQDQQPGVELVDALGNVRPGDQHRRQDEDRREHHQPDIEPVQTRCKTGSPRGRGEGCPRKSRGCSPVWLRAPIRDETSASPARSTSDPVRIHGLQMDQPSGRYEGQRSG